MVSPRRHRRRGDRSAHDPPNGYRDDRRRLRAEDNRCIVVEEGFPQSGVAAEIGMKIMENAFDYLDAPVIRITGKDVPMPYAANLEKLALPNVKEVIEAARAVTYR